MKKSILKNLSKGWTILVADGNDQSSVTNVLRQELIKTEKNFVDPVEEDCPFHHQ